MFYVNLVRVSTFRFLKFKVKKFGMLEDAIQYAEKMASHPNFVFHSITDEDGREIGE